MRILAIDPAIRKTGYAVIEGDYKDVVALDYGTIELQAKLPQSQCLHAIHEHIHNLILKWQPQEIAIERIIYVQSQQTAIIMARRELPLFWQLPVMPSKLWNILPQALSWLLWVGGLPKKLK